MNLYLIRHGQSLVNMPDFKGDHWDKGLTELGQSQAEKLAIWLPTFLPHVDAIFCSSMVRARETVAPLAQTYGMEPTFDDHLREIGNNRWNHTAYLSEELVTYVPEFRASEHPYRSLGRDAENESLMHFRTRVGIFIENLITDYRGKNVVVVCHGGVIEIVFAHIFNIGPWQRSQVWTRNTAVSLFEYVEIPRRETWRLHFHDRTEHLIPTE